VTELDPLVPWPEVGRRFTRTRRVRLGDVTPGGRLRLDALARFVQDVSNDDTVDAGLDDDMAWVVRRTVVDVVRPAVLREELALATFCGGTGSRWAERRVSIAGEHGAAIECSTLWVHLDVASGRPKALPAQFHEIYGEASGGRTIRARLQHPAPPLDVLPVRWPLRFVDLDVLGHVNNAIAWAAVEEELAHRGGLTARLPARVEVEYPGAMEPGHEILRVGAEDAGGEVRMWLVDATAPDRTLASGRVVPHPTA